MNKVSTIGLDLAKEVFQVHGADAAGAVVFRKRLRRSVYTDATGRKLHWMMLVPASARHISLY